MNHKINNYSTSDNEYGKPMSWADLPGNSEEMAGLICITSESPKLQLDCDAFGVFYYDSANGRKTDLFALHYLLENAYSDARLIKAILDDLTTGKDKQEAPAIEIQQPQGKLEVGTILVSVWGGGMILASFYRVEKVTDKSVVLIEIDKIRKSVNQPAGDMLYDTVPNPMSTIGSPFRRTIGEMIKINSYQFAKIWNGEPVREDTGD